MLESLLRKLASAVKQPGSTTNIKLSTTEIDDLCEVVKSLYKAHDQRLIDLGQEAVFKGNIPLSRDDIKVVLYDGLDVVTGENGCLDSIYGSLPYRVTIPFYGDRSIGSKMDRGLTNLIEELIYLGGSFINHESNDLGIKCYAMSVLLNMMIPFGPAAHALVLEYQLTDAGVPWVAFHSLYLRESPYRSKVPKGYTSPNVEDRR